MALAFISRKEHPNPNGLFPPDRLSLLPNASMANLEYFLCHENSGYHEDNGHRHE
jgi:hypothetical protein